MKQQVTLTDQERRSIIRLLGKFQDHLESVIETNLAPGETEPREPWMKPIIAQDRRAWKDAEKLVRRLEAKR